MFSRVKTTLHYFLMISTQAMPCFELFVKKAIESGGRKYFTSPLDLAVWLVRNVLESLTVFIVPWSPHRKLWTSNTLECVKQKVKCRTRVVRIFPNPESCLRLVSALLMQISDEWQNNKRYLLLYGRWDINLLEICSQMMWVCMWMVNYFSAASVLASYFW